MIYNIFKVLISVKSKLFFGFLVMTMMIVFLGGYAFLSMGGATVVVKDTFDRPLMAINFARSAGQVFNELEIEVLKQSIENGSEQSFNLEKIEPLVDRFKEDLDVARERSISKRAAPFFDDVDASLAQWKNLIFTLDASIGSEQVTQADDIAVAIKEQLDIIVELQANESFRAREAAIEEMNGIKFYNLMAGAFALIVSLMLSAWIAVTIITPLKAAATAARKISTGNFNVDIPSGGDDEMGVLLKTLSLMQNNIRDRMGKEQNLRALAQHRLSDSLSNSQDAILLTDAEGLIIVANPKIGDMFPALEGVDLIGHPYASFFTTTGAPAKDPCEYDESRDEMKFEDGRWARISASDTQEGGRLYIWSDITEAKIRAENLREAKEEAEAADEAKSLFLASISHELRTPLNAVIGFSDILEEHHKGPDGDADHAEMAGLISQSGAQLLNIVKDVLSIAKGTNTEEMSAEMTQVDLLQVVWFCIKTIEADAKSKNIRLLYTPPAQPIYVTGNPLRLQQLLLNLLSNAIKYNREGGAVKVNLTSTKDYKVWLDVADNGIGIKDADLGRIMQPFVQVDDGYTRKHEGVGLGLAIVKQIVDLHEGEINIHSRLEKGTVVRIAFPALRQPQPSHAILSA